MYSYLIIIYVCSIWRSDLLCTVVYRKVFYAQYNCKGPGAASNERVKWVRELTTEEAKPFLTVHFINGKTWLKKFIGKKVKAKKPKKP